MTRLSSSSTTSTRRVTSATLHRRKRERERRAALAVAIERDRAAMRARDVRHDREAEARAACRGVAPAVERLEEVFCVGGSDSRTAVLDRDRDAVAAARGAHADPPPFAAMTDGI